MPLTSRTPFCSNELPPWPRIQLGEVDTDNCDEKSAITAKAGKGRSISSLFRSHSISSRSKLLNPKDTNSAHCQQDLPCSSYQSEGSPAAMNGKICDKASSTSRFANMREAHRGTDRATRPRFESRFGRSVSSSRTINQGHTASLCWYMRLQQAEGILVPTEFSSCTLHPALVDRPQTPPDLSIGALQADTSSSSSSARSHGSISSHRSTLSSYTWVGSEASSLDSPTFKTRENIASDDRQSDQEEEVEEYEKGEEQEEDPFLYLGRQLSLATHRTNRPTFQRVRTPHFPSNPPHCICTHYPCNTYLHGPPSTHCKSCRLPTPQPEILAALSRLKAARERIAREPGIARSDIKKMMLANETVRKDVEFVERYEAEMEERCAKGVWWDGWIVAEGLTKG